MIPPEPGAKANRSERALFTAFEGILDRPDWVVIHSLAIGRHQAGLSGEIDFLVLVPGRGIVIVEAKSPAYVEYKDGRWHLDRTPKPGKDPLQQLDGARRSLRGYLKRAGILRGDEPIARLLWFTSLGRYQFVNRTPGDLQFFEWELGWQEDLDKPARLIEKVLDEHIAWFDEVDEVALDPSGMTAEHVAGITTTLLADFTAGRSKADDRRDRGIREARLLTEQRFALELLQTNPHLYFDGPAGTGKSFLLVEAAVRFARDLHMPTLLTCWNVLMAEELRSMVRGRSQLVDVDDLNTVMLRLCGLAANPADADEAGDRDSLHGCFLTTGSSIDVRAIASSWGGSRRTATGFARTTSWAGRSATRCPTGSRPRKRSRSVGSGSSRRSIGCGCPTAARDRCGSARSPRHKSSSSQTSGGARRRWGVARIPTSLRFPRRRS
jgi:hypothetical protein